MLCNVIGGVIVRDWISTKLVDDMAAWLRNDIPLAIDAPGGMAAYRETLAASLFLKFYLDIRMALFAQNIVKVS